MKVANIETNISVAAGLLKMFSHKGRLQILCALKKGEKNVGELEAITGLSQSALSQHLAILRQKDVVKTRRQAQTIFYSISDNKSVNAILNCLCDLFSEEEQNKSNIH
jgi:DNA-binding transcriptional ArsR family regulator